MQSRALGVLDSDVSSDNRSRVLGLKPYCIREERTAAGFEDMHTIQRGRRVVYRDAGLVIPLDQTVCDDCRAPYAHLDAASEFTVGFGLGVEDLHPFQGRS